MGVTLDDLRTKYSLEDVYDMNEVLMVKSENERRAQEYAEKDTKTK